MHLETDYTIGDLLQCSFSCINFKAPSRLNFSKAFVRPALELCKDQPLTNESSFYLQWLPNDFRSILESHFCTKAVSVELL